MMWGSLNNHLKTRFAADGISVAELCGMFFRLFASSEMNNNRENHLKGFA
jgi:hypothetical protein